MENKMLDSLLNSNQAVTKTMDERLSEIALPKEEKRKMMASTTLKNGTEAVKDILGGNVGGAIFKVIDTVKDYDAEEKEAKNALLLASYFAQSDDHSQQLENLKELLRNSFGKTLYVKLMRILDDEPLDWELINQLSKVLNNFIKQNNLSDMYSQDKFLLTIINNLSTNALALLADSSHWIVLKKSVKRAVMQFDENLQGDWSQEFARGYLDLKGDKTVGMQSQVALTYQELIQAGLCRTVSVSDEDAAMMLTPTGGLLVKLLS